MSPSSSRELVRIRTAIEPLSPVVSALWTNLSERLDPLADENDVDRTLRLGFTACARGDGTTTSAVCAASSLALHSGREVVLVETCASASGLAQWLELRPGPGFEELRRGEVAVEEALLCTDVPGLVLLPAGAPLPGAQVAARPLRAAELRSLWDELSGGVRHVLVDAPPISFYELALPILTSLRETILVLNAQRTGKGPAQRALRALEERGVALRGTILNRCSRDLPRWLEPRRK